MHRVRYKPTAHWHLQRQHTTSKPFVTPPFSPLVTRATWRHGLMIFITLKGAAPVCGFNYYLCTLGRRSLLCFSREFQWRIVLWDACRDFNCESDSRGSYCTSERTMRNYFQCLGGVVIWAARPCSSKKSRAGLSECYHISLFSSITYILLLVGKTYICRTAVSLAKQGW